jgi:hypothetical protein
MFFGLADNLSFTSSRTLFVWESHLFNETNLVSVIVYLLVEYSNLNKSGITFEEI